MSVFFELWDFGSAWKPTHIGTLRWFRPPTRACHNTSTNKLLSENPCRPNTNPKVCIHSYLSGLTQSNATQWQPQHEPVEYGCVCQHLH